MTEYTRKDKSDLSDMSKDQALSYLKPHYETDEDISVDDLKFTLGPPLLVVLFVGSVVAVALGLLAWIF